MSDPKENEKSSNEVLGTAYEPKLSTRFLVKLKDKEGNTIIPAWLIKEVTRPKVQWSVINNKWLWLPIVIRTYDPIVPSATQMFYEYIMEDEPKLFDIIIDVLDPTGDTVEEWEIKDAKFSQVDFGTLNWCSYSENEKSKLEQLNITQYTNGDPAEVIAVITYDFAQLNF